MATASVHGLCHQKRLLTTKADTVLKLVIIVTRAGSAGKNCNRTYGAQGERTKSYQRIVEALLVAPTTYARLRVGLQSKNASTDPVIYVVQVRLHSQTFNCRFRYSEMRTVPSQPRLNVNKRALGINSAMKRRVREFVSVRARLANEE